MNEWQSYQSNAQSARCLQFLVVGLCPLLTNNPASLGITQKAAGKGSTIGSPEEQAEAACYRLDDGTLALRGECFRAAAIDAGGAWKLKGKRATMKSMLLHTKIVEELVQILDLDGKPVTGYAIDAQPVLIRATKGRIIRYRPRFDHWSCKFTMEYDPVLISDIDLLVDVMNDAGNRMGAGDYHPKYGRFVVRSYRQLDYGRVRSGG
jgi:hypothetical protein